MRRAWLLAGLPFLLALPAACGGSDGQTATAPPLANAARLHLVRVASFSSPVYVTSAPGDASRLYVVEQGGRVMLVKNGRKQGAPFLDITSDVQSGGERGLLSVAFPPDYSRSGLFYVYYTDKGGDIRVEEFRRSSNPDRAGKSSRRLVLFQEHSQFPNHNGGQLQFGPDGDMYIGLGDGGSAGDPSNHAQSLNTLLGKILRIDPRASGGRAYSIPSSNPFTHRSGARGEIYSYGLRNPWRFSFDRSTGDLSIGDVGQDKFEEIDFARHGRTAGVNYGWKGFEGFRRYSSVQVSGTYSPPVLVRSHSSGFCAIIGGYVVRDRSLGSLYGRYLYGDNCNPGVYAVKLRTGHASGNRSLPFHVRGLSSFGQDARGRIYMTSLGGQLYRLAS